MSEFRPGLRWCDVGMPQDNLDPHADASERDTMLGLVRDRLTGRLTDRAGARVGLIVAPAGSGKSTLLAHAAEAHAGPVAWCGRAGPVPRSDEAFALWVWGALHPVIPLTARPPSTQALIEAIGQSCARRDQSVLVVADDMHLLEGTSAEAALDLLVNRLPAGLRLLLASRVSLDLDLSRLRVSGQLVDVGPDDLRFRTWEVEQLFRDVYRDPLIPEEVGALAQRTAGWAAYLQLFHLATCHKSVAERRQVLGNLTHRGRLVQEYLTRNVLADLPEELRSFLLRTCVLRRPSAALCDELLSRTGSAVILEDLVRRQLFTEREETDDSYRYHAVLVSYLDARLVEMVGVDGARHQHGQAAELLEREGFIEDALAAFARAEDWDGFARLLGDADSITASLGGGWLAALPPTVVAGDPLLLLVRAHRMVAEGRLSETVETLRQAEAVAGSSVVADRCRHERDLVAAWAVADRATIVDWSSVLRAATQREPRQAERLAARLPGPAGRFAEGFAAFLCGDPSAARRLLRSVAAQPECHPAMAAGAQLLAVVAGAVSGGLPGGDELDRVRDEVDRAGVPWLDRMARAATVILLRRPEAASVLADLEESCRRLGDRWGTGLAAMMGGLEGILSSRPDQGAFHRAAMTFEALGAGTLEAWAMTYLGLVAQINGDTEAATGAIHRARSLSSASSVPGAVGVAALSLGLLESDDRELVHAKKLLEPLGLWECHRGLLPDNNPTRSAPQLPSSARLTSIPRRHDMVIPGAVVTLRCLGAFALTVDGQLVDETSIKPMERAALHLLCSHAGGAVHREEMIEALWPEADPDAGRHRLQVAVSSLRRLLGPENDRRVPHVARDGDAYRLRLPDGASIDLKELEDRLRRAAAARTDGDRTGERVELEVAVSTYRGPLLPGDGPADWVIRRRAIFQAMAVGAATRLACLFFEDGDMSAAGETARTGLAIDRYRDDLWKILLEAAEQSDHHAEASQVRKAYQAVLDELGLPKTLPERLIHDARYTRMGE